MTPRIAPLPPTGNPPEVQELIESIGIGAPNGGPTVNIFLTLARHPGLFRRYLPFGGKLLLGGRLPPREREMVVLRTARVCGSDYEWGQHVVIGRTAGLTDVEIARIRTGPDEPAWSAADRTLLQATDQLVGQHTVEPATWTALAERFDERQLIELTLLAGHYGMIAGMLNAICVEREPGVAGFEEPATD